MVVIFPHDKIYHGLQYHPIFVYTSPVKTAILEQLFKMQTQTQLILIKEKKEKEKGEVSSPMVKECTYMYNFGKKKKKVI